MVRAQAVAEGGGGVGVGLGQEGGAEEVRTTTKTVEALVVVRDLAAGVVAEQEGGGEALHHLHHLPDPLLPQMIYSTRTSSLVSPFPTLRRPTPNLAEPRRRPPTATTQTP